MLNKKKAELSDYVIWYLGMTYRSERLFEETGGKMMYKSAWLHGVMKCEKALMMLNCNKQKGKT